MDKRFTMKPFRDLTLTTEDRAKLVEITNAIIMEKYDEYVEHLHIGNFQPSAQPRVPAAHGWPAQSPRVVPAARARAASG